eukprot:gnl/MRDRNA2_/MRDRNA2_93743_c0_seq1.p1 gnl/MRDRNA2_/MRDRNA2_93743_c0~~gnl/MRDRNA2_/MRDRNA2_93743_c0_seq1.p1  ORF type:complete len:2080 (+),score=642.51 gnl/MRDRNA2_/MRDRNA2_93743_c0_seq1:825-6242(+)
MASLESLEFASETQSRHALREEELSTHCISEMKSEVVGRDEQLHSLHASILQYEGEVHDLTNSYDEKREKLAISDSEMVQLRSELHGMQEELSQMATAEEAIKQNLDGVAASEGEFEEKLRVTSLELDEKIRLESNNIEQSRVTRKEMETKELALHNTIGSLEMEVDMQHQDKALQETEHASELSHAESELCMINGEFQNMEMRFERKNIAFSELQANHDETLQELHASHSAHDAVEHQSEQREMQARRMEADLTQANYTEETLRKELQSCQKNSVDAQTRLEGVVQQLEDRTAGELRNAELSQAARENIESEELMLCNRLALLESTSERQCAEAAFREEEQTSKIAHLDAQIAMLTQQLKDADACIEQKQEDVAERSKQVKSMSQAFHAARQQIEVSETQTDQLEARCKHMESELSAAHQMRAAFMEDIASTREATSQAQSKLAAMHVELEDSNFAKATLAEHAEAQKKNMETEILALQDITASLKHDLCQVESKHKDLKAEEITLSEKADASQCEVQNLEAQLHEEMAMAKETRQKLVEDQHSLQMKTAEHEELEAKAHELQDELLQFRAEEHDARVTEKQLRCDLEGAQEQSALAQSKLTDELCEFQVQHAKEKAQLASAAESQDLANTQQCEAYSQRIASLDEQVDEMSETVCELNRKLKQKEEDLSEAGVQIEAGRTHLDALLVDQKITESEWQKRFDQLMTRSEEAARSESALESQLRSVEAHACETQAKVDNLTEELRCSSQKETEVSNEADAARRRAHMEENALRSEISRLEASNAKQDQDSLEKSDEYISQIRAWTHRFEQKKEALQEAQESEEEARREVYDLSLEYSTSRDEVQQQHAQLQRLEAEAARGEQLTSSLRQDLERAQLLRSESNEQLENLREELKDSKISGLQASEDANSARYKLETREGELLRTIASVEAASETQRNHADDEHRSQVTKLFRLDEQVASLTDQLQDLQQSVSQKTDALDKAETKYANKVKEFTNLTQQCQRHSGAADALATELQAAREESTDTKLQLTTNLDQVKMSLIQSEQNISKLESDLQQSQNGQRIAQEKAEVALESAMAKEERLQTELASLELNATEQHRDAMEKATEDAARVASLSNEITTTSQRLDHAEEELDQKRNEMLGLQDMCNTLLAEAETGKLECKTLNDELQQRESRLDHEEAELRKTLDAHEALCHDYSLLTASNRAAEASLEEMVKEKQDLNEEAMKEQRSADLKEQTLRTEQMDAQCELKDLRLKEQTLRAEQMDAQCELKDLRLQVSHLNQEATEHHQEHEALVAELGHSKGALHTSVELNAEGQKQLRDITLQHEAAEDSLEQQQLKIEVMDSELAHAAETEKSLKRAWETTRDLCSETNARLGIMASKLEESQIEELQSVEQAGIARHNAQAAESALSDQIVKLQTQAKKRQEEVMSEVQAQERHIEQLKEEMMHVTVEAQNYALQASQESLDACSAEKAVEYLRSELGSSEEVAKTHQEELRDKHAELANQHVKHEDSIVESNEKLKEAQSLLEHAIQKHDAEAAAAGEIKSELVDATKAAEAERLASLADLEQERSDLAKEQTHRKAVEEENIQLAKKVKMMEETLAKERADHQLQRHSAQDKEILAYRLQDELDDTRAALHRLQVMEAQSRQRVSELRGQLTLWKEFGAEDFMHPAENSKMDREPSIHETEPVQTAEEPVDPLQVWLEDGAGDSVGEPPPKEITMEVSSALAVLISAPIDFGDGTAAELVVAPWHTKSDFREVVSEFLKKHNRSMVLVDCLMRLLEETEEAADTFPVQLPPQQIMDVMLQFGN